VAHENNKSLETRLSTFPFFSYNSFKEWKKDDCLVLLFLQWFAEEEGWRDDLSFFTTFSFLKNLQRHGWFSDALRTNLPSLLSLAFPFYPWNSREFKHCRVKGGSSFPIRSSLLSQVSIPHDWFSLKKTKSSFTTSLLSSFPEFKWSRLRLHPRSLSLTRETARDCWIWFGEGEGYLSPQDWYFLEEERIERELGECIADIWGQEMKAKNLIYSIFPEFVWLPWLFFPSRVTQFFWWERENVRRYMDWIGIELEMRDLKEWYSVSVPFFRQIRGGYRLLQLYGGQLFQLCQRAYPEHVWDMDRFKTNGTIKKSTHSLLTPKRTQNKRSKISSNHLTQAEGNFGKERFSSWLRRTFGEKTKKTISQTGMTSELFAPYILWLSHEMKLNVPEKWYQIGSFQTLSRGIIYACIETKCWRQFISSQMPELPFNSNRWVRYKSPERELIAERFLYLRDFFNIGEKQDWYRIPMSLISRVAGVSLVPNVKSFIQLLRLFSPLKKWEEDEFKSSFRKAYQNHLLQQMRRLFPREKEIREEYHHPFLIYTETGCKMELDVFVENLAFAMEYQGLHHFGDIAQLGNTTITMMSDKEKRTKCSEIGLTLIEVPYWWSGQAVVLKNSLLSLRPDIHCEDKNSKMQDERGK